MEPLQATNQESIRAEPINGPSMTMTPESIESTIIVIVGWMKLGIEIFGAMLVTLGVCVAIAHLIRKFLAGDSSDSGAISRTRFGVSTGRRHSRDIGFAGLGSHRQAGCGRRHPYRAELLSFDGDESRNSGRERESGFNASNR